MIRPNRGGDMAPKYLRIAARSAAVIFYMDSHILQYGKNELSYCGKQRKKVRRRMGMAAGAAMSAIFLFGKNGQLFGIAGLHLRH